jgi:catechol 2,3-dioxygenase-like lactoylglutathione lyase family enzyme
VDTLSLDGQLIAAASGGKTRELARLLAANPRKLTLAGGQWNRPLLHLAAGEGHLDCVNLLLRLGFDVNTRDRLDHATALHWAAQGGHLAVVKRLLAAGADINGAGDEHEMGVLGWATCFRQVQTEVADFLLARGARPTIFAAVSLGRGDLVHELVGADASLLRMRKMSRYESYRTPLHLAVLKNRADMVRLLLNLGADPLAKDSVGNTPLNLASARTDAAIAEMLVAAGANPQEQRTNRFESAVPILNVKDVPASFAYYVDKLGFRKEWDWGDPPTFGCIWRDQVRIFLCQGGQGAPGTWISIFVQDIDALYEDYKKRGAIIQEPPEDFPWGVREMNVEDPDGHILRMGSESKGDECP